MPAQAKELPEAPTIDDRIATALAQTSDIDMPDSKAPADIPEDETVLGTATPAIQHLFALLFELRQEFEPANAAYQQAEVGSDDEAEKEVVARRLHADMNAVRARLVEQLDAEFNPDRKGMSYTILGDWRITGAEDNAEMPDFLKALLGGMPGAQVMTGDDIPEELRALMGKDDLQLLDGGHGVMIGVRMREGHDDEDDTPEGFGIASLLRRLRRRRKSDGDKPTGERQRKSVLGKAVSGAIMRSLTARGSNGESAMDSVEKVMARIEAEGVPMDAEFNVNIKVRAKTRPDATDTEDAHTEVSVELDITASAEPANGSDTPQDQSDTKD